jgi:hypothetical protein
VCFATGLLFTGSHFVGSLQLAYHFETLMVFFILCIIAYARDPRPWPFWLAAAGALSVKEDAAVWCAAFAIFMLLKGRREKLRRPLILLLVSCVVFSTALLVMYVLSSGGQENAAVYLKRAGHFELSPMALRSLILLAGSTGFVCFAAGWSLALLAVPSVLLLSSFPFTRELLYYYSYPFLPFLFLATIDGAARLYRLLQSVLPVRSAQLLLAGYLAAIGIIQFPLPTRTDGYTRMPVEVRAHDEVRLDVANTVLPHAAPLALQFGLWGLTPTRLGAHQLQRGAVHPDDYVFADLKSPYGIPTAEYIETMRDVMDEVTSGSRKLLFSRDDIFIVGPRNAGGVVKP